MSWIHKVLGRAEQRAEHAPPSDAASANPELKTITYCGGVVVFRIPAHWVEEYASDGGGTFYDTAPDSGILRLTVITAEAPSAITPESAPEVLSTLGECGDQTIERLPNGCALARYAEPTIERGHKLLITFWLVVHVIPPRHARFATFSYTLLAKQCGEIRFQRELELLDREIRACTFSPVLGCSKPDTPQKVSLPSAADLERLSKQRAVVGRYVGDDDSRAKYAKPAGKLGLLRALLTQKVFKPTQTYELQCMGVVLGDAFVQELGLEWVMVGDEYGTDPAVRLPGTSVIIFPLTMISKRVERGENVDVFNLFNAIADQLDQVKHEAE